MWYFFGPACYGPRWTPNSPYIPKHSVLEIEGKPIGHDADCYVIAEIGHNHQGSVEQAMQMMCEGARVRR